MISISTLTRCASMRLVNHLCYHDAPLVILGINLPPPLVSEQMEGNPHETSPDMRALPLGFVAAIAARCGRTLQ